MCDGWPRRCRYTSATNSIGQGSTAQGRARWFLAKYAQAWPEPIFNLETPRQSVFLTVAPHPARRRSRSPSPHRGVGRGALSERHALTGEVALLPRTSFRARHGAVPRLRGLRLPLFWRFAAHAWLTPCIGAQSPRPPWPGPRPAPPESMPPQCGGMSGKGSARQHERTGATWPGAAWVPGCVTRF